MARTTYLATRVEKVIHALIEIVGTTIPQSVWGINEEVDYSRDVRKIYLRLVAIDSPHSNHQGGLKVMCQVVMSDNIQGSMTPGTCRLLATPDSYCVLDQARTGTKERHVTCVLTQTRKRLGRKSQLNLAHHDLGVQAHMGPFPRASRLDHIIRLMHKLPKPVEFAFKRE